MPQTGPTLLLTRPRAQAETFARQFVARFGGDMPIVLSPLIEVARKPLTLDPAAFAGLIFTSENGVLSFAAQSEVRNLPAFCVGPHTAEVARREGFVAEASNGNSQDLADRLLRHGRGRLLHLHGDHVAGDLAKVLEAAGTETVSCQIYAQNALPLSPEAQDLLRGTAPVLLPLFSPRTASLFEASQPDPRAPLLIAAFSKAVARNILRPAARLTIAAAPTALAMLDALDELLNEMRPA